jgi:hypothetical protein
VSKNVDQVITGAKTAASATVSADDVRAPRPVPRILPAGEPKPEFPTRFQSITQHRIVTVNIRTENSDGTMRDTKFNVVFDGGFVDITRRPYPFPPKRVSAALTASANYGLGKTFWDADEFAEVTKKNALEAFVEQAKAVAGTEDGRAALKAVLGDSFALPAVSSDPQ